MDNFLRYLSTAPVLFAAWMTFTAGFIIEANRFYPDALTFPTFQAILVFLYFLFFVLEY